jgi:hypothetical protein
LTKGFTIAVVITSSSSSFFWRSGFPPPMTSHLGVGGGFQTFQSAQIQAFAAVWDPPLLWDVTRRRLVVTDVSWQLSVPSSSVKQSKNLWRLKIWAVGCPETSVSTNLRRVTFQKSENHMLDCTRGGCSVPSLYREGRRSFCPVRVDSPTVTAAAGIVFEFTCATSSITQLNMP